LAQSKILRNWWDGKQTVIKLVALDLDGTLLDSAGRLPQQNLKAVAAIQALGVGVLIATGKTYWSAVQLIEQLKLSLPGVYSQGLIVCDPAGAILREVTLDFDFTDELLAYLEAQALPYVAYNRAGLLTPQLDAYHACISGKYWEPEPLVVGPMAGRARQLHINKLLIGDKRSVAGRRRDLQQRFGERATVLQAVPEYAEIMPQGISKGAGVAWVLHKMGIKPEQLLAIGDGENDLEMIKMAGIGVAVANARPELKSAADLVVASNDNGGVAEGLAAVFGLGGRKPEWVS
jgi:Cof subfamily protein (haloacid dehalogenase superfamily)